MTNSERFTKFLNNEKIDRLPMVEWAPWWEPTLANWYKEGLPRDIAPSQYFGHDSLVQFWIPLKEMGFPAPESENGGVISDEEDYERIKPLLFTDNVLSQIEESIKNTVSNLKEEDIAYWYTFEGFFWFPRTLFGIEDHLYSFYDYPELLLEINKDLCDFYKKVIDIIYKYFTPAFMTFAEDMSYNHGPMLSKECYDTFLAPFYKQIVPLIKEKGTKVFIDTDGFVEPMIPWFEEVGIEGCLPLERMAGVDVNRIRENHPEWLMLGGFDKTIMHNGEEAMRAEFERILPAMKSGRYLPSVDHQTPPDVSLENYKIYMRLLNEYCRKAV